MEPGVHAGVFFFRQKTAYEMRISDWSSDVCSSDLRIRLRVINGSAMTFFNFRIPGVPLTVIQADGQDVRDFEVDELQIGVAATYDLVVEPGAGAHTIIAQAMDRSGMGLPTLASAAGQRAAVPPIRRTEDSRGGTTGASTCGSQVVQQ